jgi:excinuclease UvrABC nuclease subunit
MQGIAKAGIDDLANVQGINKNLAQKIYENFHNIL